MTEKELKDKQKQFVEHLFFQTAWNAATQHNGIWNENSTKNDKAEFKRIVKKELLCILEEYKEPVSKEKHMENIKKLQKLHGNNGEHLDTGKSQKILNVMCKFYWCNGWIVTPPHLTIDSQILGKLPINRNKNIKWTELSDEKYEEIVNFTYDFTRQQVYNAPVEWELENWRNTLE